MDKRSTRLHQLSPIIVAVRDLQDLPTALTSPHKTIFVLSCSLSTVTAAVSTIQSKGRDVFIHFDLVEGLGKDAHGLNWLAETAKPTGIITTRAPLVTQAKSLGLATVQRMFLLDSQSLHTGLQLVQKVKPDFLELMPGIIPEVIQHFVQKVSCPIIAGGLCKTPAHYRAAREAGAIAISTSDRDLWQYRGN